jgi:hypothetical protein
MNYLKFNSAGVLELTMFEKEYVISNLEEWYAARDEIVANPLFKVDCSLMCSSSIDFPEDCTDDEDLIAICDAVRGNV